MQSSPLIPKDKVSSSTNGSIDARYIASRLQLQHKGDFWKQGTPTSPVYSTPLAGVETLQVNARITRQLPICLLNPVNPMSINSLW